MRLLPASRRSSRLASTRRPSLRSSGTSISLLPLGDLDTRQGQLEKGLQVDQRLVQIQPEEPKYHYNLACTHSLLGHIDPAFAAPSEAGPSRAEHHVATRAQAA